MLRFFRQIRHRLLAENHVSRYLLYAVGEIVLVVIGILMALEVNNWNETRKSRSTEYFLIWNLLQEMNSNYEQLDRVLEYNTRSFRAAKDLIGFYNESKPYSSIRQIDSSLTQLQWAWTFNPQIGVLKSIQASGELSTIQKDSLRFFIASYVDMANDVLEEQMLLRELIVKEYIPLVNQYVSLNDRLPYLGSEYGVGESKFDPDYAGLFGDRQLESLIAYIHTWRLDELEESRNLKAHMADFIAMLGSELQRFEN